MDNYFQPAKALGFYRIAIAVDPQFFAKFTDNLIEMLG